MMAEKIFIKKGRTDAVLTMDKQLFDKNRENIEKDNWKLLEGEELKMHIEAVKAELIDVPRPAAEPKKPPKKRATKSEG